MILQTGKRQNSSVSYYISTTPSTMKISTSCLTFLLLCHYGEALQQPTKPVSTRRAFFKSTVSTAAAFTTLAAPVLAEEAAAPKAAEEKKDPAPAVASAKPVDKPADAPKKEEKAVVAEAKPADKPADAPKKEEKTAVAEAKPADKPADAPKKEEKAAGTTTTLADSKPADTPKPSDASNKDEKTSVAEAPKKKDDPSSFAGSFTDPNHPGGKTTIRLTGQKVGDYILAEVIGGGGKNEPASYNLPAVLMGERTIFIDFTSKGGPRNFVGFLNKDGDIDFLKDGNRWSRI
jgi:outer membrane biosynthesis protein TonB